MFRFVMSVEIKYKTVIYHLILFIFLMASLTVNLKFDLIAITMQMQHFKWVIANVQHRRKNIVSSWKSNPLCCLRKNIKSR